MSYQTRCRTVEAWRYNQGTTNAPLWVLTLFLSRTLIFKGEDLWVADSGILLDNCYVVRDENDCLSILDEADFTERYEQVPEKVPSR